MKRIPRTLHAPALQRTENNKRVAAYVQNFEDAPRASVTTRGKQRERHNLRPEFRGCSRRKQREGRHLRPDFRGRSTRQHHDARKTTRWLPLTSRISRTLHASASGLRTQREGRHLRPEFRGRSTRQRHDARKTTRTSQLTPRISRTLHASASGLRTCRKQREGRHLRPEFRGCSTMRRKQRKGQFTCQRDATL